MSEGNRPTIRYTRVDEAPALATWSLLPIVRAFAGAVGVTVEERDISLAGRILAAFADRLPEDQRVEDDLAFLGLLAKRPEANIVKLPNISASVPQLVAAIQELQQQGVPLPDYPVEPATDEDREIRARYDAVKGSAVNPVLREGNSDRRAPASVKAFARAHPHRMAPWAADSRAAVATMNGGDLRGNEASVTVAAAHAGPARIEHVGPSGAVTVLATPVDLQEGAVVDASYMSRRALQAFLTEQVQAAKARGTLFSIHLKATMMKVSDPIFFGHAVRAYFGPVLDKHQALLERLGFDPNDGLATLERLLREHDDADAVRADLQARMEEGPPLAMVDSDRGVTNLHVPSDVIIDASMPSAIRDGGRMWGPDGELHDATFVIPDSSYAGVYQAVIEDCKANGAFDPATMGSVANVGLMAQKAEEYGSHDTTFQVSGPGTVRVVAASGEVLLSHVVETGDVWRLCRTQDAAIRDWVRLGVRRARASGDPAVFWLDEDRPHDNELLVKVREELAAADLAGLEVEVMAPVDATHHACARLRRGENTISVTGNVLRDYLTDLFPILEVGTSAKMLSIVPLMNGGGLFETGAGGSAPKHVQQFVKENHLRWDSLGETLALVASLEHLAEQAGVEGARTLAQALDQANARYLDGNLSPSRKVGERDVRASHAHVARFWAEALVRQEQDPDLAARFRPLAEALAANMDAIEAELLAVQGEPVELGGYFRPDRAKADAAMRPSTTLNEVLGAFGG